jgi:hypothetical protein
MGFVHDEEFETPEFTIEDIERTSNVKQLLEWLEETDNAFDDMAAQIEAANMVGGSDAGWMSRIRSAIGFAGMGRARLKKRLVKLGVNPEPRLPRSEAEELHAQLNMAKNNLAKARVSADFGRHLLDSVKAFVAPEVVAVIVADAAERATKLVEVKAAA